MNARSMGRKTVWVADVAAIMLMASTANVMADARVEAKATLAVYNAGPGLAVDAEWVAGGGRTLLADDLKAGEGAALTLVDTGRGRLNIKLAGVGRARLIRQAVRLQGGHAYCVLVQGPGDMAVRDVTRQMLHDPSPEKVCQQLAKPR